MAERDDAPRDQDPQPQDQEQTTDEISRDELDDVTGGRTLPGGPPIPPPPTGP